LIKLSKLNLVNGLNLERYNKDTHNYSLCEYCIAAKQHRRSFRKNKHRYIPNKIFEQIDTDIKGPLKEQPSLFGELWIISFICVKTRYKIIYTLKNKDQAHEALDKFMDEIVSPIKSQLSIQYEININISRIHSDMGKEYLGQFKIKCRNYGIKSTTTAPYTPEENSIEENYWKTLMETARAMLYQSQLSLGLWSYAVKYANFLLNRTLIVSNIINGNKILKTPYEWVFQNKPDLTHIRICGCEQSLCFN
jgi:transposase InsO family protein